MTRLRELRTFHDLTQAQCAKIGYISVKSYIRYENDERVLPLDTAIYYAKYYNVSLDYLAGLTENESDRLYTNTIPVEINPNLFNAIKKLSDRQQQGLAEIINLLRK